MKLSSTEKTAGGLVIGFQSLNSPYLSIQVGGFDRGYAIAEYRPGAGWFPLVSAGSLANLDISQPIHLEARVAGQTLSMRADEVDVLSYTLPQPIEGSGIGLYGWGEHPIEFSETTATGLPPRMFVIMPFAEPFDTLYRDVINPVAKRAGFDVVRVDEVTDPGIILDDIQRQIVESHAVVAEISTHNPNVFYELGYAHALRKPAVLLVRRQDGDKMPFDIKGYRAIFYDDSIGGKKHVERNLEQHLQAIQNDQLA